MCSYLSLAIPGHLCGCTNLSCAASCGKVRSHPLWQWGETSVHHSHVVADAALQGPSAPQSAWSTRAAEFHTCKKHHTVLWPHLAWTACLEITCQAFLAQPPSDTCDRFLPYPSRMGVVPCLGLSHGWGKPHVLGPKCPTAAYRYFGSLWKCAYMFFEGEYVGVFSQSSVHMVYISYAISSHELSHFWSPSLSLSIAFDNSKQTAVKKWIMPF